VVQSERAVLLWCCVENVPVDLSVIAACFKRHMAHGNSLDPALGNKRGPRAYRALQLLGNLGVSDG
jgi:hypothetical protein